MGWEKESSKSGFFQLLDWTAKSRKKLFSSKSELPERSKQQKKNEGNLPTTQFHLIDEDETRAASSIKGSSDYSCASSVTDDDGCVTRAPGVVARLMGLDSMPTATCAEPYSAPLFQKRPLQDSYYHRQNLEYHHDHQIAQSGSLICKMEPPVGNYGRKSSPEKTRIRPIDRFQTEMLPPKSAKSIPITHHKLLSPIKNPTFVPSKNAAYIMEAAAKIIDPGPQTATRAKMPLVRSSSVPLKVWDLKDKVSSGQKMSVVGSSSVPSKVNYIREKPEAANRSSHFAESSRRPSESNASKCLKGQSSNKSWNGSVDATLFGVSPNSEGDSTGHNNKGKSISLAIQAKVNVQRREGSNPSANKGSLGQKEEAVAKSTQAFKAQSSSQRNLHRKSSLQNTSAVLRQNNQKQNCPSDKNKIPSKTIASNSLGRKAISIDTSSGKHKTSSKVAWNSKAGSRKLGLEVTDSGMNISSCAAKTLPRKKRLLEADHLERNQEHNMLANKNYKSIHTDEIREKPSHWAEDSRKKSMDVVSFTFTTPMTRSVPATEVFSVVSHENTDLCTDHRGKRMLLDSESMKLSTMGYNLMESDALSILLEQKLRELTYGGELSHCDAKVELNSSSTCSLQESGSTLDERALTNEKYGDITSTYRLGVGYDSKLSSSISSAIRLNHNFLGVDEMDVCRSNKTDEMDVCSSSKTDEMDVCSSEKDDIGQLLDCHNSSPVSILEPSFWTESCNSSCIMEGSKQSASIEAQAVTGLASSTKLQRLESDIELSDSASSRSIGIGLGMQTTTSVMMDNMRSSKWEFEYVKEILCNIEFMFMDFALGHACEIVNPQLFNRLEYQKGRMESGGEPRHGRKLLFDSVSECLDLKCRQYTSGGCRAWAKGVAMVRRKDQLGEEILKEISEWTGMGDCMVDELLDKDMSSHHGRWLDFGVDAYSFGVEIEDEICSSLVDEVVADILGF